MKKNYQNTVQIDDDVNTEISLKDWSKISGIKLSTLESRMKRGWEIKEVLYRKVRFSKRNNSKFNSRIHEKVGEIKEGKESDPLQLLE